MGVLLFSQKEPYVKNFIDNFPKDDLNINIETCQHYDNIKESIRRLRPHCVIINPDNLRIQSISFIEKIKKTYPKIHIVLISETVEYAMKAFEYGVSDYIVLPTNKKRVEKMVNRIFSKKEGFGASVLTFESIKFEKNNRILDAKWRTKKAKELFAYLLYRNNEYVRKDFLIDLLWPDISFERGKSLLYANIYHVRKLLESIKFDINIVNSENYYIMYLNNFSYDVQDWEYSINQLPQLNRETILLYEENIYSYKGDFLNKYNYTWVINEQDRLRNKWLKLINQTVEFSLEIEATSKVKNIAYHMLKVCPTLEIPYFYIMKAFDIENRDKNVKEMYMSLEKMVSEEFGAEPENEIRKWYENWQKRNP